MKNRKAAFELSVTAIVILILAIVMLGLGLGFIRGMFGKVATQFEQQIASEPEPPTPSASNPLTLSRESIITNSGGSEVLKVGVYNPTSLEWKADETVVNVSCSNMGLEPEVNKRTIRQGESDTFNLLFTTLKNTPEKTYLCYVYIGTNSTDPFFTKDFTIRISR